MPDRDPLDPLHPRAPLDRGDATAPRAVGSAVWPLVGAVLVGVEAVVVLGLAVFYLGELARGASRAAGAVVAAAVLMAATAAGLALVARGLRSGRRWAKAPAITWQVICLLLAPSMFGSGRWYVGGPLVLVAGLAVVAAVLTPVRDPGPGVDPRG